MLELESVRVETRVPKSEILIIDLLWRTDHKILVITELYA